MELASLFGASVQNRHFRALSHGLFIDNRKLLQRHFSLLNSLKENFGRWSASLFQDNLTIFLNNLDNIEVPALLTLHSLTAVFEHLAAHLILEASATACIIPNSWIDQHVLSISKARNSLEPLHGDDKYRYKKCLIQLANSFCRILSRMDKAVPPIDSLWCSGRPHKSLLLRQRNAELLAILVANLAATSPGPPSGFNETWALVREVCCFKYSCLASVANSFMAGL